LRWGIIVERNHDGTRWFMLVVLFLARLAIAYQFQSLAAVGPLLSRQPDGVAFGTLGTLVGLYMLPGIVFSVPGGLMAQRFGDKQMTAMGLSLMVLGGVIVAATTSVPGLAVGRIVCGIGAVFLNIILSKMLTDWFAGREIAFAMALFVSSWPIGIGLALLVLPTLAGLQSVPMALSTTAIGSAAALLLVSLFYRVPPGAERMSGTLHIALTRREWSLTILAGALWSLFNVGLSVFLIFAPDYLVTLGSTAAAAGATVSIVTGAILIFLPLGGWLAQRAGSPDRVMGVSMLAMALIAAALSIGLPPTVACLLFGIAAGPPPGLIMSLPSLAAEPQNRSAGMGVFYMVYYAGMLSLVPLAGFVRDWTGDPASPLYVVAAAMLIACATLAAFRTIQLGMAAKQDARA
jgi:MFS family permease